MEHNGTEDLTESEPWNVFRLSERNERGKILVIDPGSLKSWRGRVSTRSNMVDRQGEAIRAIQKATTDIKTEAMVVI